jgi:hypothetical protein
MRRKTLAALADWKVEAAKLREETAANPKAFTTEEYAAEAQCKPSVAYKDLKRKLDASKVKRAKKMVDGRLTAAWVMVGAA